MSGASTWLHSQRKTELVDLAEKVGLKDYESLKKADLEVALDEHMVTNQSQLSKDSSLSAYYKRINPSSPTKKEATAIETKTPRRRTIKSKEDLETDAPAPGASAVSALARTPAVQKSLAFASSVPLPPSPAVVASHIDRQTQKVRSSLNKAYKQSGISDYVDNTRDRISTTASIETLAIIIELWGLQREILPVKYLTIVPASQKLGTPAFPAKIPDLFVLLSADFWSSFLLWLSVSVVMPMTFAYFFNLTLKAKHGGAKNAKALHPATQYDPLTFNISKALITYLIYAKDTTVFGWPGEVSKARIESNVPGGYQGVLIASGIGILASIYEAVLKK